MFHKAEIYPRPFDNDPFTHNPRVSVSVQFQHMIIVALLRLSGNLLIS